MSKEMTKEDIKRLEEAPDECIITGYTKCENYMIDNNVVYLPSKATDAYTLYQYSEDDKYFYRTRYDMDDDFAIHDEGFELQDMVDDNPPHLQEVLDYYNIKL